VMLRRTNPGAAIKDVNFRQRLRAILARALRQFPPEQAGRGQMGAPQPVVIRQ